MTLFPLKKHRKKVKKMIDSKGNVTCAVCGKYLGNTNGDGDYFALIRMKRCPECQAFFTKEKKRAWNQEKRRKDKSLKKETKDELKELREIVESLKEENELLHKRISQLKDEQFRSRISELENMVSMQAEEIEILKRGMRK